MSIEEEKRFKEAIEKLKAIAKEEGWTLGVGDHWYKRDYADHEIKHITVTNLHQEIIATAAHEIGHAKVRKRIESQFPRRERDRKYDDRELEEEFQAWAEADKIVVDMGFYSKRYLERKHQCLLTYYSAREIRNRLDVEREIYGEKYTEIMMSKLPLDEAKRFTDGPTEAIRWWVCQACGEIAPTANAAGLLDGWEPADPMFKGSIPGAAICPECAQKRREKKKTK